MPRLKQGLARRPMQWSRRGIRPTATSEAILEKLFSSIHVGIASLDREFNYIRVNIAFARAAGSSAETFPGDNHFTRFPDPEQEAACLRAVETGQSQYAYGKMLPALSARHYWDWSIEPVLAQDGQVESLVLVLVNVTAREQAQQALHQSQALFAHLFESAPEANILVDAEGRILSVNQRAEMIFGYSRAGLIGQPIETLLPETEREQHKRMRAEFMREPRMRPMAERKSQQLDLYARRLDGGTFPAEITLSPFQSERGVLVLCVVRDVSERKHHEEELEEKTELVRLLQDVAVAANESNTVQEALQFAIDRLCNHLGWPIGHAVVPYDDSFLVTAPVWYSGMGEEYTNFRSAGDAVRFSTSQGLVGLVVSTGQPAWMNDLPNNPIFGRRDAALSSGISTGLAVPVLAGREVVSVLEFFHPENIPPDPRLLALLPHIGIQLGRVIERRRSEEALRKVAAQLRMVIINLPVILWVINREGRLIMLEGQGVAAAGLPRDLLLGQPLLDMLTNRPDIREQIQRALSGESIHAEIPSENDAVFETYYTPYYDENWAVDGVIGLSFDISQRKRMESELEEVKHRLLESVETERSRLGKQLHDGPLQDLYGAYYQIQEIHSSLDGSAQDTIARAMQTIQQVNATLRVICGDLHPTTLVHLGLVKAIRSHAELLQERTGENYHIHLDLPDDQESFPLPMSHPLRLAIFRTYQQLINNAVMHSNAKHIWVRLRTQPDGILLEVQDNGVGFDVPKRWLDLVREGRFGLASVFERVNGLDGSIKITSKPGWGTLVSVKLPVTL
jgi:PAS domain S-box-containing protein